MHPSRRCPGVTRRSFLADTGLGFTGLALGALLYRDGIARADALPVPDGKPHFTPKAKSVIWIFLCGGVSHVESFDPKPELNKYAGKTIDATPYKDATNPAKLKKSTRNTASACIKGSRVRSRLSRKVHHTMPAHSAT